MRIETALRRSGTRAGGMSVLAAGIAFGYLLGTRDAAVRADVAPGIAPITFEAVTLETHRYPPAMRVGNFDGAFGEATAFTSARDPTRRVAYWTSRAGALRTDNYPADEFVLVLEGALVTTDGNGTRREFGPGDTFVIPKGWAGVWDMTRDFKKVFVNF